MANSTDQNFEGVRTGVCGFCLPQQELFHRFRVMEVQQTFYWPPQLKTVERWRRTAPEDFEFTLKAFQAITHTFNRRTYRKTKFSQDELMQCGAFRDTPIVRAAWNLTRLLAVALESTLVVFQCPPSLKATDENVRRLRQFFHWASRGKLRFGWEPRHDTWSPQLIAELCRELDLIHVVDPFERQSFYGSPNYYRLHGKAIGGYRYDFNHPYSDEELQELLARCDGAPSYCMFNNIQMATDATKFQNLASAEVAPTLRATL
jgi:uncharacterized protein YecE (DUF72 family)